MYRWRVCVRQARIQPPGDAVTSSLSVTVADRALAGIALKICSVAVFVVMGMCIKLASHAVTGQIIFFRSFFALFPILAYLAWEGNLRAALHTQNLSGHIWRGTVGVTAMGFSFFALTRLPLPDAIALGYAMPLVAVVFGAVFLKETVRLYRWTAVAIGFVGVFVISWPKLVILGGHDGMSAAQAQGAIAALIGAALAAVAMILVRRLVHTERTSTIVLYFSLISSVMGLSTLPFGWVQIGWAESGWLVGAGVCGGIAQIFLTQSYRFAETQVIAPFEYVSIIFGTAISYLVFSEVPTIHTVVGAAIVIAAGMLIIYREHRLGLERRAARKAITPQG